MRTHCVRVRACVASSMFYGRDHAIYVLTRPRGLRLRVERRVELADHVEDDRQVALARELGVLDRRLELGDRRRRRALLLRRRPRELDQLDVLPLVVPRDRGGDGRRPVELAPAAIVVLRSLYGPSVSSAVASWSSGFAGISLICSTVVCALPYRRPISRSAERKVASSRLRRVASGGAT